MQSGCEDGYLLVCLAGHWCCHCFCDVPAIAGHVAWLANALSLCVLDMLPIMVYAWHVNCLHCELGAHKALRAVLVLSPARVKCQSSPQMHMLYAFCMRARYIYIYIYIGRCCLCVRAVELCVSRIIRTLEGFC